MSHPIFLPLTACDELWIETEYATGCVYEEYVYEEYVEEEVVVVEKYDTSGGSSVLAVDLQGGRSQMLRHLRPMTMTRPATIPATGFKAHGTSLSTPMKR